MTSAEVFQVVGYGFLIALLGAVVAVTVGAVWALLPGPDDGYSPIGRAAPPPERRSPFASSRDDVDAE